MLPGPRGRTCSRPSQGSIYEVRPSTRRPRPSRRRTRAGWKPGSSAAYESGLETGLESALESPYEAAYESGLETGLESALESSYETAYESGLETGLESALESPYESGLESPFETGFDSEHGPNPILEADHFHENQAPSADLRTAIARVAEQQLQRWRPRPGVRLVETDAAASAILRDYYLIGVGHRATDAQLREPRFQADHPWSAVFISWVMRTAGAGSAFPYSTAHQHYIRIAKRNRMRGALGNPCWAFRPTEITPRVGDLVCLSRSGSGATYDNIDDGTTRPTHCDIVTEVGPGYVRVIGGNVDQSVSGPAVADAAERTTGPDGETIANLRRPPHSHGQARDTDWWIRRNAPSPLADGGI